MERDIILILIIIGVALLFLFLLRELFLWYFRINTLIKLQKEQVELQKKMILELGKLGDIHNTLPQQNKSESNTVKTKEIPKPVNKIPSETIEVRAENMKEKLKEGEAVVYNKEIQSLKIMTADEFEKIKDKDQHEILYEK